MKEYKELSLEQFNRGVAFVHDRGVTASIRDDITGRSIVIHNDADTDEFEVIIGWTNGN